MSVRSFWSIRILKFRTYGKKTTINKRSEFGRKARKVIKFRQNQTVRRKSESIVFEKTNDKQDGTLTPNTLFNLYSSSYSLFSRYVVIKATK